MVNYSKIGYSSIDEYSNDFLNTLLESNHTYEFYVNWDKVYANLEDKVVEIIILNSLNKIPANESESKFREIIVNYPEVVPLLPLILAIRNKKVPIFNVEDKSSKIVNFSKNGFNIISKSHINHFHYNILLYYLLYFLYKISNKFNVGKLINKKSNEKID